MSHETLLDLIPLVAIHFIPNTLAFFSTPRQYPCMKDAARAYSKSLIWLSNVTIKKNINQIQNRIIFKGVL